jgi:hypothetical protein
MLSITGFIDHLQVVLQTTITLSLFPHFAVHCYTYYCPRSTTFSTIRFLATDFNTGNIRVSLNYTLQISLYYSTRKIFSSQLDCKLNSQRHLSNFRLTAHFTWKSGTRLPILSPSQSQSQGYVTTDGQSASLSWNKAPLWG